MVSYAELLPAHFRDNFTGRHLLVGFRPYSSHPDDAYLFMVMGRRNDGTYSTWVYNATAPGFSSGQYDLNLERALALFSHKWDGESWCGES